ncbi:YqaA family protein [Tabrizicola sp. M-4]|jgi:membrane protein YqaA with SNARE-associated domain|uniref:YqaA family protein n=1 Tax=Tabrizicola sp. M-4 TaxID=3055847 RepID=UPI003DA81524
MLALAGLFTAAFVAATLIPAQSEVVLAALVLAGGHPVWLLVTVATAGNVLGALAMWGLGWLMRDGAHLRWSPVSPAALTRAQGWYGLRGWWTLFLAWVPVIGDPLVVVAGLMREPLWRVTLVVTLAKAVRYVALVWITLRVS